MTAKLPTFLKTYLGWKFDAVLPGTFQRNKKAFAHLDYPILAPLPTARAKTPTIEGQGKTGPFVYFVCDANDEVRYVGKSNERQITQRWIRPGNGGPSTHYWTHSIGSGGCVFHIANGLGGGESAFFTLNFVPVSEVENEALRFLGVDECGTPESLASNLESALIRKLRPDWNSAQPTARRGGL